MKKPEHESRRAPRYTQIIDCDCKVDSFPEDLMSTNMPLKQGESFRAKTINVSTNGMLINCDYNLPERTILKIIIPAGEVTNEKFHLSVRIAWFKRNAYKLFGRYAAGLQIIEGDKLNIQKLIDYFKDAPVPDIPDMPPGE